MWLLLIATAHAGLHADLRAASVGGPDVVVACTSGREALARTRALAQAMGRDLPPLPPSWTGILGEDLGSTVLGEDGAVRLSGWRGTTSAAVAFASTEGAAGVARRIAAARGGVAIAGDHGWSVTLPDGAELGVVEEPGRVAVSTLPSPPPTDHPLPESVYDALPETPGCIVTMHFPPGKIGPSDLALHLPFTAGEPLHFVWASERLEALRGVALRPQAPPPVRTRRPPDGVVVLGVGIDGLDFSTVLHGDALREARRLQRLLPLTSGSTLAIFHGEPDPLLGAALPFGGRMPARRLSRRLGKLLDHAGIPAVRSDASRLTVAGPDVTLYSLAQDQRLLLATDPEVLADMATGEGTPWVEGRAAELAQEYPVVTVSSIVPDGESYRRLAEPVTFGMTLEPGMVRGELHVPLSIADFGDLVRRSAAARRAKLGDRLGGIGGAPEESPDDPPPDDNPGER